MGEIHLRDGCQRRTFRRLVPTNDRDVFGERVMNNFSLLAANRLTHLGDAGARLRDAGRRLWPIPQRPAARAHLYKYNSGTGNCDGYTRLLNRTIAARWRAVCATDCEAFALFVGACTNYTASSVSGSSLRAGNVIITINEE